MNTAQQKKFQSQYRKHLSALRRQGKAERTIDSYARAVRRVAQFWGTCPDALTQDQLAQMRGPNAGAVFVSLHPDSNDPVDHCQSYCKKAPVASARAIALSQLG